MQATHLKTIVLAIALCGSSACSRGAAPAQAGTAMDPSGAAANAPSGDTGSMGAIANPCDVITTADVASLFTAPAKARSSAALSPEYKNCQYATKSGDIVDVVVSQLGPGNDMAWKTATTYSHIDVPLAGIGDAAMRSNNGTKLAARKGNMFCGMQLSGYDSPDSTVTADRGEALARKLGALCNKVFASH